MKIELSPSGLLNRVFWPDQVARRGSLGHASPPHGLVIALRVTAGFGLISTTVQFVIWLLVGVLGGTWVEPWWIWVGLPWAVPVGVLLRRVESYYRSTDTESTSQHEPADPVAEAPIAPVVAAPAPGRAATPPIAVDRPGEVPVRLRGVSKGYGTGASAVQALNDVSIDFPRGSFTAVMGPSGSGKSTLLHCAAGLDEPTSGSVSLVGTDLSDLDEAQLGALRRDHVAFVFQAFNLMPALTVRQNVVLPTTLAGRRPDDAWVSAVIEQVGLTQRAGQRPAELSGGQQQRVAIARALASRSQVIFADEPTGALDSESARGVLELLRRQSRELGQTIVMVTHDPIAASYADRVVFLVDGRIVAEAHSPTVETVAARLAQLTEQVNRAPAWSS